MDSVDELVQEVYGMKDNKVNGLHTITEIEDQGSGGELSPPVENGVPGKEVPPETRPSSPEKRAPVAEHCMSLLDAIWAGDSALHLAIVNGDLKAVKYLISKGADINRRFVKNVFDENNISCMESLTRDDDEKYKAFGYYGEYPLSFAAVFGHTEIYDYLIQHGVDTNAQDSYGNTVLHNIVIHNQIDMFSYAMRHPWKRANPWIKNNDNLTPIALCCKLGFADMFDEIMELSRVELWKYSDLECSLYPMASFDTIGLEGKPDNSSALMLLVNGEETGHLKMLHHIAVQKVLEEKWRVYLKGRFISRVTITLLHLLFLSVAIYTRPKGRSIGYVNYLDGIRYFCELVISGGSFTTFLLHVEEIKANGLLMFLKNLRHAPSKAFMLLSTLLILLVPSLRLMMWIRPHHDHSTLLIVEETFIIIAAPTGWVFVLFTLKSHHSFGPLIITLYKMVAKDVTKVMVIFVVFWFMFAVIFYYLYKNSSLESMNNLGESVITVFHMSFGSFEYKHFEDSKYPPLTTGIFLLTMMLMPILLLNMLIATMGNTFNTVVERAHQEWYHQYAKTLIILEKGYSKEKLLAFQRKYTQELTKNTRDSRYSKGKNRGYLQDLSSDDILAGIPVTKKVPNTKAFVKKRSLKNWKWLYGVLRTLLKAKRAQLRVTRRITFWDLFGSEDILESDYLREKMVAENLRKISLTHLFKRSFEQDDLLTVASKALSTKVPASGTTQHIITAASQPSAAPARDTVTPPVRSLAEASRAATELQQDEDSLDAILNT